MLIGIITFSGGWHIPEEILSGTFKGAYNFSNPVTFQNKLNYEIEGDFKSCKDILEKSFEFSTFKLNSGIYKINPSGVDEFEVYCDMITDGGGWTLVQHLVNGTSKDSISYDVNSFKDNFYSLTTSRAENIPFDEVLINYMNSDNIIIAQSKITNLENSYDKIFEKTKENDEIILKSNSNLNNRNTFTLNFGNELNIKIQYEPLHICSHVNDSKYYQYYSSSLSIPYFSTYSGCQGDNIMSSSTRINRDEDFNRLFLNEKTSFWFR